VAVIDIDPSKIDPSTFIGNVIDLGTEIGPGQLVYKMCRNPKNSRNFEFPLNRLLSIRGIITDDELRKPNMYDENDERCFIVLKHGRTTGLTVGRANNLFSYTRNYFGNNRVSKEWAILPFNHRSGPFCKKGDSGSVIVDGTGRIGGLLTGGSRFSFSSLDSFDIAYATPISSVLEIIHSNEVLANAYPWEGPLENC
jgi:hypothetical protein